MNEVTAQEGPETPRLWIVSELYYPEETSTGYILTRLAEGLADAYRVHVICSQPTYSARGTRAPKRESHNGVTIERCWGTTWNKDVLPKRLVNLATISISLFLRLLVRLRRREKVLVVTNPPLLPFLVALACRLRGAQCVLMIQDVYPDVAVAAGLLRADSRLVWLLQRCVRRLYRSVETIVVLGRDMRELVLKRSDKDPRRVTIIPNWADVDDVRPEPRAQSRLLREHGLLDKFVVQYAGNMGRVHDIEAMMRCAVELRHHDTIHFLILGSGAKKAWLERTIADDHLTNVTVLPPFPRSASSECLNACDVAINALVAGMQGVSVPSRTYNTLAAGKPIIAVVDRDSELAQVIHEEDVGWVVAPGDASGIARAILDACARPEDLAAMGRRARLAAETKYPCSRILSAYAELIKDDAGVPN